MVDSYLYCYGQVTDDLEYKLWKTDEVTERGEGDQSRRAANRDSPVILKCIIYKSLMLRGGPPVCSVHHVDEINEEEVSEWEPETPPKRRATSSQPDRHRQSTKNNQSSDKPFTQVGKRVQFGFKHHEFG